MSGPRSVAGERVIVPTLDAASSVACLRSLGRHSIPTVAISELEDPPGFVSKYCDERFQVPDPDEDLDAYGDALLTLARRDDVRTIVPLREADVYCLARRRSEFEAHVHAQWPTFESLRTVQDRVRLFDEADAIGVNAPRTALLSEFDDWDEDVIVKPRYTVHSPGYDDAFDVAHTHHNSTQYVPDSADLDVDAIVADMGHVPLVQEYVRDTDEYAFFALYDHGDAVATFQFRQQRGYKYAGGPSAFREAVDIPDLQAAGRGLLDHLDWHGLAMVEFLRDPRTGEFELMEINPRFWTSLPFSIQAGVDFPYYYWLLSMGYTPTGTFDDGYDVGRAGHLLRGELLHLHSILFEDYPLVDRPSFPRTAASIAASLVRYPTFDYLSVDDPRPFFRDIRNALVPSRRRTR